MYAPWYVYYCWDCYTYFSTKEFYTLPMGIQENSFAASVWWIMRTIETKDSNDKNQLIVLSKRMDAIGLLGLVGLLEVSHLSDLDLLDLM